MSEPSILGQFILHGQARYTALSFDQTSDTFRCRNETTGKLEDVAEETVNDYGEWTERKG
jgi:hypothetical protein